MKPPGHWQHFILRNDNRGLTTEQMRQKYLKESQIFEQFITFQMQQQQIIANTAAGGGGGSTTSLGPTPLTLAFEISSDSGWGTTVLLSLATKPTKSVNVTYEWDDMGLVSAGSVSETIAPNTTSSPTIDLGAIDNNVPFRIVLSDASAIQNITWTASDDDFAPNQYQIWTAPTNLPALENVNLFQFEFHGVQSLDLSNYVGNTFRWLEEASITSVDLTNANIKEISFSTNFNSSLTTLTLTGLTYGDESGGYSFNFFGCALDQSTIVALLEAADASGYENGYINVSGGNNFEFNGGDYTAIEPTLTSLGTTGTPGDGKGWEVLIN